MDKRARMALERVCEEEVANQPVQPQGCREFPPPELSARHPADLLLSGSVSQLVSFMQAIADRFTTSVQAASQELMIRVEDSSSLDPSSNRIQNARALFEKRVMDATNQMEAHRQWLAEEFRNLDSHWYGNVLTKAVQSDADVGSEVLASQSMLQDQSVDLSLVMRALAVQNQRRTYLKGLKLQIQG
ncbi:MAG TPA: hypothetical protein VFO86_11530 [Terriglobia bacterium]|nr:hypothetical protein [Terriglobia bacterium]